MDALPQRPVRALKIHDENAAPITAAAKTIHQRNKSSPALYTLANGSKAAPKRTAFADVTNTARQPQVKDDSVIISKSDINVLKDVKMPEPLKPAPLTRPQRPLSVAGLKGFINTFTSHNSSTIPKPSAVEVRPSTSGSSVTFPKPAARTAPAPKDEIVPAKAAAPPPVPLHESRSFPAGYQALQPLQDIKGAGFNFAFANENNAPSHVLLPGPISEPFDPMSHIYSDVRSDGVRLYAGDPIQASYLDQHNLFEGSEIYVDAHSQFLADMEPQHMRYEDIDALARASQKHVDGIHLLPVTELEEYWDEEGYDDNYEGDGFTTTRSLKSRGDYTTGPTTVLIAPRMTAKVEREIAIAKQIVMQTKPKEEVDDDDSWDTSMVSEYSEEIFEYMKVLEERMRPNPYYMDMQTEVQWSMRSVLMDWLVQVHLRFNLLPETLYLCVNYIDRFLSCKVVSLGKLQLVGATAIFVAAKYEEINCPSVSEIVYMVDNGYTVEEILKAERFMLSMLQFELGWPGPMSFLRRISKADDYDLETRTLAKYFLEITIMDERFVGCIPSYTAGGAHCLARLMLKKGTWSPAHIYYSNYTYAQLRPLLVAMLSCCEDPQKHHAAIFDKYSDNRFKKASIFVNQELRRGFMLPLVTRSSMPLHELSGKSR